MTNLPPSSSNSSPGGHTSAGFERLHEKIQRWVWDQGWTDLRDIQELAISPILDGGRDVIIAAATAGGKTEAAFLPICSRVIEQPSGSVRALYVSPLKALINDQFDRLDRLCERLEIPVHRWHGDVSASHKQQVISDPAGILLITPESLEALFVLRGTAIAKLFSSLDFVVVDELHSFIGSERGQQLQSLLSRLELVLRRRVPRIALSATLGDMELATEFLRPGRALPCEILVSSESKQEVRLQIRGYRVKPADPAAQHDGARVDPLDDAAVPMIGAHLFEVLRSKDNLIFANSRRNVEIYGDHLRRLCEQARVPNEFWPHHGSLSKELRDHAESVLKDPSLPASVVCTTTLEMGIDIGSVASIAQVGVPPSVAGLRQRLGRSGRRGEPSILRIYIEEPDLESDSPPQDQLRAELVEAIAMVRLLMAKWCEPPNVGALHLSTLVQQVLSLIAQYGGAKAVEAWRILCRDGAFPAVTEEVFVKLLRELGRHDLVIQSSEGTLLLGVKGESIVNNYRFYTAFVTPEEYHLVSGGRELGTLPISHPLSDGSYIIFAGQRWRVISVDVERRIVDLEPSPAGRAPRFTGGGAGVHERVRQEMRAVYESADVPPFLDPNARALLQEGREAYARYRLKQVPLIEYATNVALFCWAGDRVLDTLLVQLRDHDLPVERDGVAVIVNDISADALIPHLRALAAQGPADAAELADTVANKLVEKHHIFLSEELLSIDFASSRLDSEGAWQAIVRVVA
ncbi:MAG: DEAD/DEAH box helicase [Deltaproteobacteria bacterium]|nr:DEAD/DEAH box helicase [Deltaproteobacteria bacterium]MDZ4346883.1 DEAD/DEAH box helicase [Candidatus Binatia bacterium]